MRKRLRKKRHLGEFRQHGFEVAFKLVEDMQDGQVDRFWDRFVVGFIEPGRYGWKQQPAAASKTTLKTS